MIIVNFDTLYIIIISVTIISFIIITLLFWTQLAAYLTISVSEELVVDTSRSPSIEIKLDITFPRISCDCK